MQSTENNTLKENISINTETTNQPLVQKAPKQKFFQKPGLYETDDQNRKDCRTSHSSIQTGRRLGILCKIRQMGDPPDQAVHSNHERSLPCFLRPDQTKIQSKLDLFTAFKPPPYNGNQTQNHPASKQLRSASKISILFS